MNTTTTDCSIPNRAKTMTLPKRYADVDNPTACSRRTIARSPTRARIVSAVPMKIAPTSERCHVELQHRPARAAAVSETVRLSPGSRLATSQRADDETARHEGEQWSGQREGQDGHQGPQDQRPEQDLDHDQRHEDDCTEHVEQCRRRHHRPKRQRLIEAGRQHVFDPTSALTT